MFAKVKAGSIIVGTFLFAAAYASAHTPIIPGEKLDSGLGEMPHYSDWAQHPELAHLVREHGSRASERVATVR